MAAVCRTVLAVTFRTLGSPQSALAVMLVIIHTGFSLPVKVVDLGILVEMRPVA